MLAAAKIRYLVVHCADTPDDQRLMLVISIRCILGLAGMALAITG